MDDKYTTPAGDDKKWKPNLLDEDAEKSSEEFMKFKAMKSIKEWDAKGFGGIWSQMASDSRVIMASTPVQKESTITEMIQALESASSTSNHK